MLNEQDLNVFFGVPAGYSFSDPRVLYDPIAARWFASGFAFNASHASQAYLAVSAGTDPSASWTVYQTGASTDSFDQPKIGVTTDKLVLSWNEFSGTSFVGQQTQVIQKSDLLAGRAPAGWAFSLDNTRFDLVPVPTSSSSTAYLVYNGNVLRGTPTGGAYIGVVAITGTPTAADVVWNESDPAIIPTSAPPAAEQPAGAPTLDTGGPDGDKFLSVTQASDVVSIMGNDGCVPNGDTVVRSCLRLIQVSISATPAVLKDLDEAATGADLFYPAVATDSIGNLFTVLSGSSPSSYPSVFGGFQPSGASGGLSLIQLQAGVGVYNSTVCQGKNRWGDYSGAALDPAHPTDVWVAGEYSASRTDTCDWGTAIAQMTLAPPTVTSITPPSGPVGGGTTVTVTGTDFAPGATTVNFGQTASPTVTVQSSNQLTAVTPAEPGGTVPVTAVTANGTSSVSPSTQFRFGAASASTGGQYHPLAPVRILDTRNGTGGVPAAPIGPGGALTVQVAGVGAVPATASAAVINVTVTDTTASSYLTVYPTGVTRPLASNLNWVAGSTVPNLVEIPLGTGGQATIYNAAGNTDVLFDVAGYVSSAAPGGPDGLYNPLVPARILDTRNGTGAPVGPLGAGGVLNLLLTGQGGVPPSGISAVVLNVTVTNPTAPSYLTVFPTGTNPPLASNLNFVAGQTVPNRVIVAVGTSGQVSFFNAQGSVDVVADVGGWFTDSSNPSATGSTFVGVTPARVLDTRNGTGLVNGVNGIGLVPVTPLGAGEATAVQVAGQGGVPAMTDPNPPNAVVANVTVTNPTASGYLTAWPDGSSRPLASDLNWVAGLTVPNLVVVKLGSSGMADLYNAAGCTDAIVDVVGYYTGPLPPASSPLGPTPSCRINGNPWGYNFTCCNFITAPPANFCAYFSCIANFPNGNGYVIECLDTMYSKSGGIQGACSFHGGVWRPLYKP